MLLDFEKFSFGNLLLFQQKFDGPKSAFVVSLEGLQLELVLSEACNHFVYLEIVK